MSTRRSKGLCALLCVGLVFWGTCFPRPAYAVFGEEDWLSGQNALLSEILAKQIEEITQLATLIANLKLILKATNESLSMARTVKRVYEMVKNYDFEDLVRDAKTGLYRAIPEAKEVDDNVAALIENKLAIEKGNGAFFSVVTSHDGEVSRAARRSFEHGYQSLIWPQLFPEAMRFHEESGPVDELIHQRYVRTHDQMRRAVQRTALHVLSEKVKTYVEDAEGKDNLELMTEATNAQVNFQSLGHLTEIRNLKEQEVAMSEAALVSERAMKKGVSGALELGAARLFVGGPRP